MGRQLNSVSMSQSWLVLLTPGYFYTSHKDKESVLTNSEHKDQNISLLSLVPSFYFIFRYTIATVCDRVLYTYFLTFPFLSFVLPGRPNQLHLLFAQMSTTAPVTMMMSRCQVWPSLLRLKTSSMSKR